MNPEHLARLTDLRERARAENAQYPQYDVKFDDHVLCVVEAEITTKLGLAFSQDEVSICPPHMSKASPMRIVYSFQNHISTAVATPIVRIIHEDEAPIPEPEMRINIQRRKLQILEQEAEDIRSRLRCKEDQINTARATLRKMEAAI